MRFVRRSPRAAFRYVAEDAPSGYGDAADRLVRALRASGISVEYRGWSTMDSTDPNAHARAHSRDPDGPERGRRSAATVAHLVPEHLPRVRRAIRRGPLVSHTVWETDRLPDHWPDLLNAVDRVVVPTEWNREVFVASGVTVPVVVVPHVVCDPVPGDGGVPLGLPSDLVVFYTIGRWDQRKSPSAVIRAYLEAFTADDPVALVVKTSPNAQYPTSDRWGIESAIKGTTMLEVARIVREFPRPALVRVEVEDWEPARIAGLHARGDCFVSLSHGEGWGLGAFDAVAYGNPVVMTGWGGQLEFLDRDATFLVDYDLEPIQHWQPRSYSPDQHWAIPRIDHAVEQMRTVAADLGSARRRAAPLRARVLDDFGPSRVAATLLEVVPELGDSTEHVSRRAGQVPSSSLKPRRRAKADDLLLVGLTAGPWRPTFDNWIEMAERFDYQYELVGLDVAEPYVPHATKWRVLLDYFEDLPRDRVVFYLDAADGFVTADGTVTRARYESYGTPIVFGAESVSGGGRGFDVPDPEWRRGNAGGYVGLAGVVADVLREGYELNDWEKWGLVSDQRAMLTVVRRDAARSLATVDHRRCIVQNIAASKSYPELDEHRLSLDGHAAVRSASSVHFFGDNGRGYNEFARLYGLQPSPLQASGRFDASVPTPRAVPVVRSSTTTPRPEIPRIAHFVFGLRSEPEPLHLVHYLAIRSCLDVVMPDRVLLHCGQPPFGRYWDLIEPLVEVEEVEPAPAVAAFDYRDPEVRRYVYAHHSDFVRLDVLSRHGGLYADLDTLFVGRLPERLWRTPFVIGREADAPNAQGRLRPALSNAVLMSEPGSTFVEAWRAEIAGALDGSWANHSCFLANALAERLPDAVHVEPQRTFHAFEPSKAGIALLLEHPLDDLDGVATMHLAAHLWWDEDRRDFTGVHGGMIDEAWIRSSGAAYAMAARRFLPAP